MGEPSGGAVMVERVGGWAEVVEEKMVTEVGRGFGFPNPSPA